MRIAITSTCNTGKTTLVNDMLSNWPVYSAPEKTWKDIPDLNLNSDGDEESQRKIRDFMYDQIQSYKRSDNIVFDRSLLDNWAYTLELFKQKKVSDDFLVETFHYVKSSMKYYDIIFFIPLIDSYHIPIDESKSDRDLSLREPIDFNLKIANGAYRSVDESDEAMKSDLFPSDDCAALIEIYGSREGRIALIQQYLNEDGNAYGDEEKPPTLFGPNGELLEGLSPDEQKEMARFLDAIGG